MENQMTSPTASVVKPRRRLKPEMVARFVRSNDADLTTLYSKPVQELTELELHRMKQAFLRGI